MFKRMPEVPRLNLSNGTRIEFMALTKAAILRSDFTAFETVGYFFRKGQRSYGLNAGATCTIYFSRDYIFNGDNLGKIVADLHEQELKNIPEFMKEENGAIKKYMFQIKNSIKVFLENEKLLSNNSNGMGKRAK